MVDVGLLVSPEFGLALAEDLQTIDMAGAMVGRAESGQALRGKLARRLVIGQVVAQLGAQEQAIRLRSVVAGGLLQGAAGGGQCPGRVLGAPGPCLVEEALAIVCGQVGDDACGGIVHGDPGQCRQAGVVAAQCGSDGQPGVVGRRSLRAVGDASAVTVVAPARMCNRRRRQKRKERTSIRSPILRSGTT